jgi:endogenous inhibitor of DNA gyrase (YacG/DUF329 family)
MAELAPMKKPAPAACPTCGKPETEAARPFCSDRCRDVDLNRWLTGAYAIPAVEEPDPDEEGEMGEILPLDREAD